MPGTSPGMMESPFSAGTHPGKEAVDLTAQGFGLT